MAFANYLIIGQLTLTQQKTALTFANLYENFFIICQRIHRSKS